MATTYDVGDMVRISAGFAQSGVAVDPTTVTLIVAPPTGAAVTYTYPADITKDSTGNYHVDYPPTVAGTHRYRWTSTGVAMASEESWFQVRPRKVA